MVAVSACFISKKCSNAGISGSPEKDLFPLASYSKNWPDRIQKMIPNDNTFSTAPPLCVCVCCAKVVAGIVLLYFTSIFDASSLHLPVIICPFRHVICKSSHVDGNLTRLDLHTSLNCMLKHDLFDLLRAHHLSMIISFAKRKWNYLKWIVCQFGKYAYLLSCLDLEEKISLLCLYSSVHMKLQLAARGRLFLGRAQWLLGVFPGYRRKLLLWTKK